MFNRKHHQNISEVLQRLNAEVLKKHCCYFGGGTAIALMNNEYRESVDIDFLVSDSVQYRALRELLTGPKGISAITSAGRELVLARDIRTDQYGIRMMVQAGDTKIKFEIISEGRISFDVPGIKDHIGQIVTLSRIDLLASKLLANADRWNDDSVFSRDLIDLSMMHISKKEFDLAVRKAIAAYGESVLLCLRKAIERLLSREGLLDRCMSVMKVSTPKAVIWQNLERLMLMAPDDGKPGAKKGLIRAISDQQLETFLEKDLPEINNVLGYLKDK